MQRPGGGLYVQAADSAQPSQDPGECPPSSGSGLGFVLRRSPHARVCVPQLEQCAEMGCITGIL